jgi:hypothetical protein
MRERGTDGWFTMGRGGPHASSPLKRPPWLDRWRSHFPVPVGVGASWVRPTTHTRRKSDEHVSREQKKGCSVGASPATAIYKTTRSHFHSPPFGSLYRRSLIIAQDGHTRAIYHVWCYVKLGIPLQCQCGEREGR